MDPFQQNPSPVWWESRSRERASFADGRSVGQRKRTVAHVFGDQSFRDEEAEYAGLDCGCTVSSPLHAARCMVCDAIVCTERHRQICCKCYANVCVHCAFIRLVKQQVIAVCEPCKLERERTWLGSLIRDLFSWVWPTGGGS